MHPSVKWGATIMRQGAKSVALKGEYQKQPGAARSSQEQAGAARRNQEQPGAARGSQEQPRE